jgi:(p)ppGpp synthase/HD superfamily hydrolase
LREAHDLALKFFDGFYRAQEVPFICHLVRVSSIVLAERQPLEVVMAALLHSAYLFRAPHSRRAQLKQKLGESVEALVSAYTDFPWRQEKAIERHLKDLPGYTSQNRQLLVIRLANELEDHLDDSMVYRGVFPYREWIETHAQAIVELARRMGLKELAQELEEVFKRTLSRKLPAAVERHCRDAYELPEHRRYRLGLMRRMGSKIKRWIASKESA